MRVAVVGSSMQMNVVYRATQPAHAMSMRGHEVALLLLLEEELRYEQLAGFDAVLLYRLQRKPTRALVERLRAAGVAVVWDNDDDLTTVPDGDVETRVKGAMRSQFVASFTTAMLRLADVVTTPSARIAAQYRDAGAACVHVVENFVAEEFSRARRRPHAGVVIGWAAALEHAYDVRALGLVPTLRRLIDAHPDVRVVSVGLGLQLDHDRYERRPFVPFEQLAATIADFDVGIAPLADMPFNRSRSNVKVKEYAALGIPWLASPIGPYAGLGEKQGGRLVSDDGWFEALDRLVTRARDRKKLGKAAARWAQGEALRRNAAAWEAAFVAATKRKTAPPLVGDGAARPA